MEENQMEKYEIYFVLIILLTGLLKQVKDVFLIEMGKKSVPKNLFFYLWHPIVMGPKDSEFFLWKSFTYPIFAMKVCPKNGQINNTKTAWSLNRHKTSIKRPNEL